MRAEEEERGEQQSGGAMERATPLSHFTGARPRLRQKPRDSSDTNLSPRIPSPRARRHKMAAQNKMAAKLTYDTA